jgi:8-oxo-dGTP pyrophosphatase MutT (NUDIX family)
VIAFDVDGVRFNYRVAGICIHQEHVLLQEFCIQHDQRETETFWALPGGRAELRESSHDTLAREMREEMGLSIEVGPLFWIVENFFTFDGREFHELALYYRIFLPADCPYLDVSKDFMGLEDAAAFTFRWFPIDQLTEVTLHPNFLRTSLTKLPDHPVHLIHHDS